MRALQIAATGMSAQQMRVEVISNNLANMSTTGYNARRAEFADLHYQQFTRPGTINASDGTVVPTGVQLGLGVRPAAVAVNVAQGSLSATGGERILAILGPGAIVGELAMLDGLPRSASVVAVRNSELYFVSRARFDECTRKSPEIYKHLVVLLASRLRETDDVIAAESFLPLKGRVALTLLELAEHFGDDVGGGRVVIRHKFGQSELAAMAGIARENVNRILADWKRRKLVSRLSGYYCLENRTKLEAEADQ